VVEVLGGLLPAKFPAKSESCVARAQSKTPQVIEIGGLPMSAAAPFKAAGSRLRAELPALQPGFIAISAPQN